MQKLTIPYEILFRFGLNDEKNAAKVMGAHYKTLTVIMDEGESISEKEGPALDVSQADPVLMNEAIGSLNAALVLELNEVKTQLNQATEAGQALETEHNALIVTHNESLGQLQTMTVRAADLDRELGHVTRERDEALAREKVLTEAAEAGEAGRHALLETLGDRSGQIEALQVEVKLLQGRIEQLVLPT